MAALAGLLVLVACKPSVPEQYIQPDDMEDILYDYYISQGMANLPSQDRMKEDYRRDLYFRAVLKKHGLTRAEFDSSLVYYYTRADYFVDVFKNVQERLSEKALSLGASEGEVERFTASSLNGDTANVWEGDRSMMLIPKAPYNRVQFYQKADTTYHKGDSFMLVFKSDFLYQGGTKDGLAYLAVKYENDSVAAAVTHFSVSGNTQLRLGECAERVKEVSGYFYLGQGYDRSADLKLLFLTHVQLIRFHKQKQDAKAKLEAEEKAKAKQDSMRRPVPDSLAPQRHRLGERPVMNVEN